MFRHSRENQLIKLKSVCFDEHIGHFGRVPNTISNGEYFVMKLIDAFIKKRYSRKDIVPLFAFLNVSHMLQDNDELCWV